MLKIIHFKNGILILKLSPFHVVIITWKGGNGMCLVYVTNTKNGKAYVYESTNYWDEEKEQSPSKRACIGKFGDEGNVLPSKRLTRATTCKARSRPISHN